MASFYERPPPVAPSMHISTRLIGPSAPSLWCCAGGGSTPSRVMPFTVSVSRTSRSALLNSIHPLRRLLHPEFRIPSTLPFRAVPSSSHESSSSRCILLSGWQLADYRAPYSTLSTICPSIQAPRLPLRSTCAAAQVLQRGTAKIKAGSPPLRWLTDWDTDIEMDKQTYTTPQRPSQTSHCRRLSVIVCAAQLPR